MHRVSLLFILLLAALVPFNSLQAGSGGKISRLLGPKDSVLLTDPTGKTVVSIHAEKMLVPASTLKVLTALTALHYLRPEYQFVTEFYLDNEKNLKIKGYGDPLLVSENMAEIARTLSRKLTRINQITLDDTYFSHPISIPGVSRSRNPYDATNGALCVNFNTVNFKRSTNGKYISAESQTPLLPVAIKKIKASGLREGRIVFSQERRENTRYTGQLLAYFLKEHGISIAGDITLEAIDPGKDELIFRFRSPSDLTEVARSLLAYSNNYIANQILLALGSALYSPPATLEKGVRAVLNYAKDELGIKDIQLAEGSGISRKNRISAADLMQVLERFQPYRHLMKTGSHGEYYKTGSLHGIRTRAGYIESKDGRVYRFVVMLNTPEKSTNPVMKAIKQMID
jgi:serine-type D-Ala-D-Ala carboxypeptidase/endopeptidase (penicillin-binding protein 4)